MRTSTKTDIGTFRFQAKRVEGETNRDHGTLTRNLSSSGSKTQVRGFSSTPNGTAYGQFTISDEDRKENLQLQFHRRKDSVSLSIDNPGRKGDSSRVSIPLGSLGETEDKFFSEGFFPSNGVSRVDLRVEKDKEGQYSVMEVRRGQDTQPQAYRVDGGKIYEVPMDAGFRGYLDIYS